MDATIVLAIVGLVVTLLVAAIGVRRSVLELRKLNGEIQDLQRSNTKERVASGDAPQGLYVYILIAAFILMGLFDRSSVGVLDQPANGRQSRSILKRLKRHGTMLLIFGLAMSLSIGLVLAAMVIVLLQETTSVEHSVFWVAAMVIIGAGITQAYVRLLANRAGTPFG